MDQSDAKLVERCLKGDARSWESVLHLYSGRLFNMAYRYTGRAEVAQELTQDIFLKVYQNLSSFKADSGSFRNWIMRVGRNLVIDHYRSTKREKKVAGSEELESLDFTAHSTISSPFTDLYSKERARYLLAGLEQLTLELKEAVLLRDIEGFTYQEIAGLLQIPEGTVKSRINRGRIELARVIRKKSDEETVRLS